MGWDRRAEACYACEELEPRRLLAGTPLLSGQAVKVPEGSTRFTIEATAGGTVDVSLLVSQSGGSGTPHLVIDVDDPNGKRIKLTAEPQASDTDFSGELQTTVTFTPAISGTYTLLAIANEGPGVFSAESFPGTQTPNSALTTDGGAIASGQTVTGDLVGQLDVYTTRVKAGDGITLGITPGPESQTGGSIIDPFLQLVSPGGAVVGSNTNLTNADLNTLGNAKLQVVAKKSGTYYIVVGSADGAGGPYQLTLQTTSPGLGNLSLVVAHSPGVAEASVSTMSGPVPLTTKVKVLNTTPIWVDIRPEATGDFVTATPSRSGGPFSVDGILPPGKEATYNASFSQASNSISYQFSSDNVANLLNVLVPLAPPSPQAVTWIKGLTSAGFALNDAVSVLDDNVKDDDQTRAEFVVQALVGELTTASIFEQVNDALSGMGEPTLTPFAPTAATSPLLIAHVRRLIEELSAAGIDPADVESGADVVTVTANAD